MVNNQKGLTLIELVVGMAILGIIFVPMMNMFDKSIHLGNKLNRQSMIQLDAQDSLYRVVDGFTYNQQSIPGLRSALDVNIAQNNRAVGYLTTGANVSYYLENGSLFRVVNEYPENVAIAETSGGTIVLSNVKEFSAVRDAVYGQLGWKLINITLETEKGSGSSKNGIKLVTSVLYRNQETE